MFRKLLTLALLCLALAGCAQKPQTAALPNRLTPTKDTENDMLRCYPLDSAGCRFFALGEDLYAVESGEGGTALIRYSGKNLVQTASAVLPGEESSVRQLDAGFSCYDPGSKTFQLLDSELQQTAKITLPDNTRGVPVISRAGTRLYYLTDTGLMEANLESGVHRLLREMPKNRMSLCTVMTQSGVILCADQMGKTHFLSTKNGAQLASSPKVLAADCISSRDCLALRCGYNDCLYLEKNMLPLVPGMHFLAFLPALHSALVYQAGAALQFRIYDLSTGNLSATLNMKSEGIPTQAAVSEDGRVFFVLRDAAGKEFLYQWAANINPKQDFTVRLSPLYTGAEPNQAGLEQCRQRAGFLEAKYGIRVLLHDAALRNAPSGYELDGEHIPAILMDTLERVERTLLRLPTQFIRQTVQSTGTTYLCLVRSIQQGGEMRPYLQVWQGKDSYLYIAASEDAGECLLRALNPMIDTQIIIHSDAYDRWGNMNPSDFVYGDCAELSAFADEKACLSPAEDRASLLLAALEDGNRELFCSAILQNKLRRMCVGIRSVYTLDSQNGTLPWEQYLWEPL